MANKFTTQVLRDTTTDAVIKLTGTFDGTTGDEKNASRIQANTLVGALNTTQTLLSGGGTALSYYNLQLTGLKYYVNFPTTNPLGSVELFWSGAGSNTNNQYANSATIFHLQGQGEFGLGEQLPSILNNSGDGKSANTIGVGDLGVATQGAGANSAYTLIISVRKDNAMYQRGQFNDPAAFNYGNYALKP